MFYFKLAVPATLFMWKNKLDFVGIVGLNFYWNSFSPNCRQKWLMLF